MSMVANAYDTNQNLSQCEIVDLLATSFSGTLRSWWDKHLIEETRGGIRKAVKMGDDGFLIFNEKVGMGEPDCVNTLIYTIIKHFIGIPSNITARISDVLNNLILDVLLYLIIDGIKNHLYIYIYIYPP
jgi:hypothetical protein